MYKDSTWYEYPAKHIQAPIQGFPLNLKDKEGDDIDMYYYKGWNETWMKFQQDTQDKKYKIYIFKPNIP